MSLTDIDAAVLASKRLNWPVDQSLRVQSMISAALSNLSKSVARDPMRRNLLMTNPLSTEISGVTILGDYNQAYVDLSTLIASDGIMLDTLQYGTIFHNYEVGWLSANVEITPNNYITISGVSTILPTGLRVRLSTSGTIPVGLAEETDYYIIQATTTRYSFATTYANAVAGTAITISGAGSGDGTIISQAVTPLQWMQSPNQAATATNSSIPYFTGWLQNTLLYLQGIPFVNTSTADSVLTFAVPFQPLNLQELPVDAALDEDFIDELVGLAASMGISDQVTDD